MSQSEKEAFASNLGLSASDLINLSTSDAQKILTWLGSRSLHFGQSAFLSLESLLDQKGITYNREDLATKAILIDVLTGVISPLDDGDLVISVYSLNKVAEGYGLTLSGANLSWEDLLAIYQANPTARVIAHINGNHYVVITGITQNSITYIDPGIGKDKQNESLTVTKEGFLKAWKGNVTLEQNKVQIVTNYQNKVLSAQETQNIRGAFWGSILGFLGSIFVWIPGLNLLGLILTGISVAVSAMEGDWISAISSIVTLGIAPNGFGAFFSNVFHGVTQSLGALGNVFNAVGGFVSNIYNAVTGFFGAISNGIGGFLHGALGVSSHIAADIARTAVGIGVDYGVSKGLETIGVNPQIAGFLGSLAAGAIIGGMKTESTVTIMGQTHVMVSHAQYIQQSLNTIVTLNQVGRLGMELGLDPAFTNIIGLSLAAIQGNIITNPGTTLGQAFSNIKPQLFSSLAQYGMDKLGTSIGLDPRISTLIGTPISGVLNVGFKTGWDDGDAIIAGINDGILRGVASIGIEYATQQANLDPLLGSLTSRAITGAIEGALGGNIFGGIYDAFIHSALNVTRLGISGTDPWSQAQYLQRVINFSDIIQQKGLAQAIEDNATQIFHEDTVSSILKSFPTIKAFVQDALDGNKTQIVQIGGINYRQFNAPNGDYFITDMSVANVIEVKQGNTILHGVLGKDAQTGQWGVRTGTVTKTYPDGTKVINSYQEGNLTNVQILGVAGGGQNPQLSEINVKKSDDKAGITFDSNGNLRDADIERSDGFTISLKDGLPSFPDTNLIKFSSLDAGERQALKLKFDLTDGQLDVLLGSLNQNIKTTNAPTANFGIAMAFAGEIVDYEAEQMGEFASWVSTSSPGIWNQVSGFFKNLGKNLRYATDYTKSHFFGQSDPQIINRVYGKILDQNLKFFNGHDYNYGETTLTRGDNDPYYQNADNQPSWWKEDEIVIVRYQDKVAEFGASFFDELADEKDSINLADPEVIDSLGKRYKDPNATQKIESFMSSIDLINSFAQGVQAFTGGDGVYHIKIERLGLPIAGDQDVRHWRGYIDTKDENGNDKKIDIQDNQFLLDLIRRSRG